MTAERRLPRAEPLPSSAFDVYLHALAVVPDLRGPEALDPYTAPIRQLYAVYLLDGEINNGGFSQVLFNGLGVWFDEAIAGLGAAGLEERRRIVDEAAAYGTTLLDELRRARRGSSLESYAEWADSSGFEPFDDRWYEQPSIDEAFDRFVVEHADEIWAPA